MIGEDISHYRIIRKLGAGGMGEVYLADDTTLGRRVALKFLPPEHTQNRERLQRFTREARSASSLNHPGILTIHEFGEADGRHFIATEFVDRESLRTVLTRAGRMDTREALDAATQVAAALAAAHEAGIVHRDINPENIMRRRDGYVKVLDFGLAKLTEPDTRGDTDGTTPTITAASGRACDIELEAAHKWLILSEEMSESLAALVQPCMSLSTLASSSDHDPAKLNPTSADAMNAPLRHVAGG